MDITRRLTANGPPWIYHFTDLRRWPNPGRRGRIALRGLSPPISGTPSTANNAYNVVAYGPAPRPTAVSGEPGGEIDCSRCAEGTERLGRLEPDGCPEDIASRRSARLLDGAFVRRSHATAGAAKVQAPVQCWRACSSTVAPSPAPIGRAPTGRLTIQPLKSWPSSFTSTSVDMRGGWRLMSPNSISGQFDRAASSIARYDEPGRDHAAAVLPCLPRSVHHGDHRRNSGGALCGGHQTVCLQDGGCSRSRGCTALGAESRHRRPVIKPCPQPVSACA